MSTKTTAIVSANAYAGPIPHPQMLQAFDHISPGLAKQITDDAFANSAHKREQESKAVAAQIRESNANVFTTYLIVSVIAVVALGLVGGGMFLVITGRSTEGWIAIGSAVLPALISVLSSKKKK